MQAMKKELFPLSLSLHSRGAFLGCSADGLEVKDKL